ncbi:putative conserved plasma membrane protein [Operophtera brumata]|uniref:Integral membrane protein 2 n=1 Tax=Operophtera brumata TaxID=104452 RepID=A0A0L7LE06_OPEBR|nr:putative conserved plasma membrane protein [Operophtera brumata]
MPLRWSSDPDVQVFSTASEDATDEFLTGLREQFDIGDSVEKISVMDNGRHVNFIHDFEANVTGIVDSDRCFMMELDPETVMRPEVLVVLRAYVPNMLGNIVIVTKKIRKRSADAPAHDYIQFAGRRVQEIQISNLADLLQREQDARLV